MFGRKFMLIFQHTSHLHNLGAIAEDITAEIIGSEQIYLCTVLPTHKIKHNNNICYVMRKRVCCLQLNWTVTDSSRRSLTVDLSSF